MGGTILIALNYLLFRGQDTRSINSIVEIRRDDFRVPLRASELALFWA
jgi:hypothetical protein